MGTRGSKDAVSARIQANMGGRKEYRELRRQQAESEIRQAREDQAASERLAAALKSEAAKEAHRKMNEK